MAFKIVSIELTSNDKEVKGSGRWKDGKTIALLTPSKLFGLAFGSWNSDRESDIDSGGGTEHAVYRWDGAWLVIKVGDYSGDTISQDLVKLSGFKDWKVDKSGSGFFYFRKEWKQISWKIKSLD